MFAISKNVRHWCTKVNSRLTKDKAEAYISKGYEVYHVFGLYPRAYLDIENIVINKLDFDMKSFIKDLAENFIHHCKIMFDIQLRGKDSCYGITKNNMKESYHIIFNFCLSMPDLMYAVNTFKIQFGYGNIIDSNVYKIGSLLRTIGSKKAGDGAGKVYGIHKEFYVSDPSFSFYEDVLDSIPVYSSIALNEHQADRKFEYNADHTYNDRVEEIEKIKQKTKQKIAEYNVKEKLETIIKVGNGRRLKIIDIGTEEEETELRELIEQLSIKEHDHEHFIPDRDVEPVPESVIPITSILPVKQGEYKHYGYSHFDNLNHFILCMVMFNDYYKRFPEKKRSNINKMFEHTEKYVNTVLKEATAHAQKSLQRLTSFDSFVHYSELPTSKRIDVTNKATNNMRGIYRCRTSDRTTIECLDNIIKNQYYPFTMSCGIFRTDPLDNYY